jgi:hypothetical protein
MTVQINRRDGKESTLDKVLKGLASAKAMTGVAVDYTNLKSYFDQKSDRDNHIVPSSTLLQFGDNYNVSDTQTANAIPVGIRNPDGTVAQKYFASKSPKGSILTQLDYAKLMIDGAREVKPGTSGSFLISHVGPDGNPVQSALKPKQEKDEQNLQDPVRRLATAPAETKSKVGLIANALRNMTDYENAYASGESPPWVDSNTKLIGMAVSDTKLTAARRQLDEAVGRLNSGGVIGKEELVTFRAMGARPGDSPDIQAEKIGKQRQFLEDRLAGFGFSPQELGKIPGFNSDKMGYGNDSQSKRENLLVSHQKRSKGDSSNAYADRPPEKGVIDDGYMFQGGDPGNPKNWIKVGK